MNALKVIAIPDSESTSDSSLSFTDSYSAEDVEAYDGHGIRFGPSSSEEEDVVPFTQLLKPYLNKFIVFMYIFLLNVGIPYTVYYFTLNETTLLIPYWVGYSSLLLTNLFKILEGIAATSAYVHRKITKDWRLMIDTETREFIKVYDTDVTLAGSNQKMVLVDGLPLRNENPPIQEEDDKHIIRITHDTPKLLILIVAYLVNERDVIEETLTHMGTVIYSGHVEILLVYNTPLFDGKQVLVDRLIKISDDYQEMYGKTFHIAEHTTSHSKAENVNYGLQLIRDGKIKTPDIVGMYDADHQPELWAWERVAYMFLKTGCDVLQGRCVIRNNDNFFARIIAVEYELMYTLHQKGGQFLRGYGIFGGSNGFWIYEVLDEITMDESMLTEDIDSNFRAMETGAKVIYADDVISYELTPPNFRGWVSQRVRWSQGWFEVTFKHTYNILKCRELTWRQRLLTLIYLPWREMSPYLMAQILPSFVIFVSIYGVEGIGWGSVLSSFLVKDLPIWMNTLMVGACISTDSHRWYNPMYKPVSFWSYIAFIMFSPVYLQALLLISMVAHCKHFMSSHEWVVTPR